MRTNHRLCSIVVFGRLLWFITVFSIGFVNIVFIFFCVIADSSLTKLLIVLVYRQSRTHQYYPWLSIWRLSPSLWTQQFQSWLSLLVYRPLTPRPLQITVDKVAKCMCSWLCSVFLRNLPVSSDQRPFILALSGIPYYFVYHVIVALPVLPCPKPIFCFLPVTSCIFPFWGTVHAMLSWSSESFDWYGIQQRRKLYDYRMDMQTFGLKRTVLLKSYLFDGSSEEVDINKLGGLSILIQSPISITETILSWRRKYYLYESIAFHVLSLTSVVTSLSLSNTLALPFEGHRSSSLLYHSASWWDNVHFSKHFTTQYETTLSDTYGFVHL